MHSYNEYSTTHQKSRSHTMFAYIFLLSLFTILPSYCMDTGNNSNNRTDPYNHDAIHTYLTNLKLDPELGSYLLDAYTQYKDPARDSYLLRCFITPFNIKYCKQTTITAKPHEESYIQRLNTEQYYQERQNKFYTSVRNSREQADDILDFLEKNKPKNSDDTTTPFLKQCVTKYHTIIVNAEPLQSDTTNLLYLENVRLRLLFNDKELIKTQHLCSSTTHEQHDCLECKDRKKVSESLILLALKHKCHNKKNCTAKTHLLCFAYLPKEEQTSTIQALQQQVITSPDTLQSYMPKDFTFKQYQTLHYQALTIGLKI